MYFEFFSRKDISLLSYKIMLPLPNDKHFLKRTTISKPILFQNISFVEIKNKA